MALDIPKTFGALLLGGLASSLLSGYAGMQSILYFKLYPEDSRRKKGLVVTVWFLDSLHTALVWSVLWSYLIDDFGNAGGIDVIRNNLAMTGLFTAILSSFVQLFLVHRIFMLSRRNYFLTLPIVVLVVFRVVSAAMTSGYMIKLRKFSVFIHTIGWNFTTGVALSSFIDVSISVCLIFLLWTSRTGQPRSNATIDSLIRYTFETGSLTCVGTFATLLCWLILPTNLIFLGMHFMICKLYANSLLVILNVRKQIREVNSSSGETSLGVRVLQDRWQQKSEQFSVDVEVNVERVQFDA